MNPIEPHLMALRQLNPTVFARWWRAIWSPPFARYTLGWFAMALAYFEMETSALLYGLQVPVGVGIPGVRTTRPTAMEVEAEAAEHLARVDPRGIPTQPREWVVFVSPAAEHDMRRVMMAFRVEWDNDTRHHRPAHDRVRVMPSLIGYRWWVGAE